MSDYPRKNMGYVPRGDAFVERPKSSFARRKTELRRDMIALALTYVTTSQHGDRV